MSTSTHSYCPYKGRHRIIIIIVAGFPRASSRWRCAHAETQLLLIRENENGATNSIETPTRSNSDDQMGMDEQFVTGRPSDEPSGARAPARASAPSRPVPSDDSVSTWQLSGQGCTDGTVQPCCTQFFSLLRNGIRFLVNEVTQSEKWLAAFSIDVGRMQNDRCVHRGK